VIGETVRMMTAKGARADRIVATLGPCICGDCYEVGEAIASEFDAQFPGTATTTRFGGPGIDIAAAALRELAAAGIAGDRIVESRPRVAAATQYLSEDGELAELCRTDGEGATELAERIDGVRHSLCTLENPLWYSHRRASLANKNGEGRMLALIVME
ncbi:MAG TPA: laccase domain-containing protein, partial [Bifidobacterium pullorum]|nr:laccase domain-containing protein [Bifidobacterium pullorum]